MLRKLSAILLAGAFAAAGCAHKQEPQPAPQPAAGPAPQPAPAPQPPPPPTCTNTQVLDDNTCLEVAAPLQGLRVELACRPAHKPEECGAQIARPSKTAQLGGRAGQAYDVTLRFRGVVELNSYTGGSNEDYWYKDGKPADKRANVFSLEVSAPAQVFRLNAGNVGKRTWPIDYQRTVRIDGGATVTLIADSSDSKLVTNRDAKGAQLVVPDVPPAPDAFDGQFVQVDVVSVAPAQ